MKARNIAEAGLNETLSKLMSEYGLRHSAANFPDTSFAGGDYRVTIENAGGRALVQVRGLYGRAEVTVGMDVRDPEREPRQLRWDDFAIFANGNLSFNGTPPAINGDLHTNQEWTLNGSYANVDGQISALNEDGIPEHLRRDFQVVNFPSLADLSDLIEAADAAGELRIISGNYSYDPDEPFNGITIVEGNLTFNGAGDRIINGLLYVTGDVTANGATSMTMNGSVLAHGTITFNGASGIFTYVPPSAGDGGADVDPDEVAEPRLYAVW